MPEEDRKNLEDSLGRNSSSRDGDESLEEPEWFTAPASKSDTVELRGFDEDYGDDGSLKKNSFEAKIKDLKLEDSLNCDVGRSVSIHLKCESIKNTCFTIFIYSIKIKAADIMKLIAETT